MEGRFLFKRYTNIYARWIRALAVVTILIGFSAGLLIWAEDFGDQFIPFLTTFFSAIVTSIFMFGFAEVIEILYRMHQRLDSLDRIKSLLDKPNELDRD
jgi:hypothetical protein